MGDQYRETIIPLYFNSKDRINVDDPTTNYTIALRKSLRNISSLQVSAVSIPRTFTNINVNNNTLLMDFMIDGSSQALNIEVDSKEYTEATLATEITTVLNTNAVSISFGLTWAVVYDAVTYRFDISVVYPPGANTTSWGVDITFTALVDILGIGQGGTTTKSFSTTASTTLIIDTGRASNLRNNLNINITSTALTADIDTSYIKSLGKSFNIDATSDTLSLITEKTLDGFSRIIPLASDTTSGIQFGNSIAISQDGSHIVAGAKLENSGLGVGVVLKKLTASVEWEQLTDPLRAPFSTLIGLPQVGTSSDISSDGQTIALGGPLDAKGIGAVYVFTQSGINTWALQSKVINGPDVANGSVGQSVALSSDGNTLATGGDGTWVRVFLRTGSEYAEQQVLTAVGLLGASDMKFGISCDISQDGNTAVFGAPGDNTDIGAVVVYTRDGAGVWTQQDILRPAAAVGLSAMGTSVSLSADGNTLAVGGPVDTTNYGAVWVFTRTSFAGVWSEQTKIVGLIGYRDLGFSVALSDDGDTLAMGAPGITGTFNDGAVWIWGRTGIAWAQEIVLGPAGAGESHYGSAVGLSGDGKVLSIGAENTGAASGAVWVYEGDGAGAWTETQGPTAATDVIGESAQTDTLAMSADGSVMVVGGYKDEKDRGAAWLYYRDGKQWTQFDEKISPVGIADGSMIGASVSMSNDGVLFALGAPDAASSDGKVIVYSWDPVNRDAPPVAVITLTNPLVGGGQRFGAHIALSGDGETLVVTGSDASYTWVYTGVDGNFTTVEQLNNMTLSDGDSIDVNNDGTVFVVGVSTSGVVLHTILIWEKSGAVWTRTEVINNGNGTAAYTTRGTAVAINDIGDLIVIGAPRILASARPVGDYYLYGNLVTFGWTALDKPTLTGVIPDADEFVGSQIGSSVSISADGLFISIGDINDDNGRGAVHMIAVTPETTVEVILVPGGPASLIVVAAEYNQLSKIVPAIETGLVGVGSSAALGVLENGEWVLSSGTPTRGGWFYISLLVVSEVVTITIPQRAYTIFDLVNIMTTEFAGDDIVFTVTFDAVSETITILAVANDQTSATFIVDSTSSFNSVINFSGTIAAVSQVSDLIDFSINNHIIKTVNPYLQENASVIYDNAQDVSYRKYRPGFVIDANTIVDIQLRDERDRIIDLNNTDWIMTIYATIHD
jgi:hypothetical protein